MKSILLSKSRSIKDFNKELSRHFITHIIYLYLIVNDYRERTYSILITKLKAHKIIIEKSWINRYKVTLNINFNRLMFNSAKYKELACDFFCRCRCIYNQIEKVNYYIVFILVSLYYIEARSNFKTFIDVLD